MAGTGQFDDIAINFYDTSLQPYAIGTGYLFSSLYTGTTGGLSTSTANLLGTADSSGGVWTFAPSLTLTAGVMYYFYENGAMPLNTTYGAAPYTTGTEYYSYGPTNTYTAEPGLAKDFLVTGTAVTPASVTPEPSSLLMLATGLPACVGSTVRRSRRSA